MASPLAAAFQTPHHTDCNLNGESFMSAERSKVVQRFEECLGRMETLHPAKRAKAQLFHLHNALNALEVNHAAADLHLDEFDRHELGKDYPELEADKMPTVDELRTRFDTVAGGLF